MIPLLGYLSVGGALFCIGVYGALSRRNMLGILIGVELMFNAANINFVAFNRYLHPGQPWGQGAVVFVIALAAAESVVGLALILTIYRHFRTVLTEELGMLKG